MRIYLACTVRGDRHAIDVARRACSTLEALGHDVLTRHLLEDDVEEVEGRQPDSLVFERDIQWLTACDALVAEASGSSSGVGFEVGFVLARARQSGQRLVVLYDASRRSAVSRLISGNVDPHCRTLAYRSIEDIAPFLVTLFQPADGARQSSV